MGEPPAHDLTTPGGNVVNSHRVSALSTIVAVCALLPIGAAVAHPDQHGGTDDHLIGTGATGDLELLSVARLTDVNDLVADVAVDPSGEYAYLANWGREDCAANSEAGGINNPDAGVYVVDIRDLEDPKQVGFIPYPQDTRPGEGVQAVEITTAKFSGTMLVANNEQCGGQGKGGVTLYDVTDPERPRRLSVGFGDRGFADSNDIHGAFAWDAGDRAYVVIVDNLEWPDVDILDITNPRRPRLIAEYDLNDHDVDQPGIGLTSSFIHDMVVKEIDGRFIMLVSYWDGGYVLLDVTDPTAAEFLGDTDYEDIDPLLLERTGIALPPEGNGHQAEFTTDNRFFIATDEDFAPYAVGDFTIATGPHAGEEYPSVSVGGAAPVTALPDQRLNGPTVNVGYACPDSANLPLADDVVATNGLTLAPGEELIAVIQRGPVQDPSAPENACFPGQKADRAMAAGYDAVVFVQHHVGHNANPAVPFCGSGAFTQQVVAVCTTHVAYHDLFDSPPTFEVPYDPATEPAIGSVGHEVDVDAIFDGWGYVHLFDAETLEDLDLFAVPEAHDENFALGFGDLSVHEVATHPTNADQAYLSYYSAGMRSLEILCTDPNDTSSCELVETGSYLDPEGNDFWGVEAFLRNGRTIVLGSDRDSGLWIFEDLDP